MTAKQPAINPVAKAKASVAAALKKSEKLVKAFPLTDTKAAALPAKAGEGAPAIPKKGADRLNHINVKVPAGVDEKQIAQHVVAATLSPSVCAGQMVQSLTHPSSELGLNELSWYFKDAAVTAATGDLSKLQEMLAVQARALDAIFYNFGRRAATCTTFEARDACLKIALKAQSQSRSTVESLAVIQQGPTIFAKQANVNQGGQQQVNNGVPAPAIAPASPVAIPASTAAATAPRVRERKAKQAKRTIGRNQDGSDG